MASTIWLAVSTSWPSIIMNSYTGLDRCHLPRSLIVALLDHKKLYYSINAPLTFPCFASGKPIPRRKNSSTTTLSKPDIELLISTNITYLPKDSNLSPNYSLDSPHPFVKRNYDLSSVNKTPSWIYQSYSIHHTSNLSFGRRVWKAKWCKIQEAKLSSHSTNFLSRSREISIKLTKIKSRSTDFLSRSRHILNKLNNKN